MRHPLFVRSVYRFFLKAPTDDVMYGVDRDKGIFVLLIDDFLELLYLETGNDGIEHLLLYLFRLLC